MEAKAAEEALAKAARVAAVHYAERLEEELACLNTCCNKAPFIGPSPHQQHQHQHQHILCCGNPDGG
jgi:hypothetical protein